MKRNLLLLLMIAFTVKGFSQIYFPPLTGTTWDTIAPSNLGWCQDSIQKMYQWLENTDTKAFIVLKNGKIVLEKYFGTFSADSLHVWNSAGKTLTAYAIGIAQKEGSLSINDSMSYYLGNGWSSMTSAQENAITIKNQLTMTTGLDDGVPDNFCTLPSCLVFKAAPGTRWAYHNAPYTLLDSVLKISTGLSINTYVNQKISSKIGMHGLFITNGYNHIYVSKARSMARFGLLLSQNGFWNGVPVLDDSVYLADMRNSSQNLNKSYGYLTWLNGKSSFMIPQSQFVFSGMMCPNAPVDMYAAEGKNGQIINVVPSQGIVLIRMGSTMGNSLVGLQYNDTIWQYMNHLSCGLSTEDLQIHQEQIYPNPFQDEVNIPTLTGEEKIQIYTADGKRVNFHLEGNIIQFPALSFGVYFIKIDGENTSKVYKLIRK